MEFLNVLFPLPPSPPFNNKKSLFVINSVLLLKFISVLHGIFIIKSSPFFPFFFDLLLNRNRRFPLIGRHMGLQIVLLFVMGMG